MKHAFLPVFIVFFASVLHARDEKTWTGRPASIELGPGCSCGTDFFGGTGFCGINESCATLPVCGAGGACPAGRHCVVQTFCTDGLGNCLDVCIQPCPPQPCINPGSCATGIGPCEYPVGVPSLGQWHLGVLTIAAMVLCATLMSRVGRHPATPA